MAVFQNIGTAGALFKGEDKLLRFRVRNLAGVLIDISGWSSLFVVREYVNSSSAILSISGSPNGSYHATESLNTQYMDVTISAAQMRQFNPINFADRTRETLMFPDARRYPYSLKRTDTGVGTILAYGYFIPELTTQA